MRKLRLTMGIAALITATAGYAVDSITVPVFSTETNQKIGTVTATDSNRGLLLYVIADGFTPGEHGFHLHEKGNCGNKGMDAGGHFNPNKGTHLGPYDKDSELGDLPRLDADKNGHIEETVTAPKLKVGDLYNHSFMVHAGGDTYTPAPANGGGGARVACGVIPAAQ